MAGAAAVRNQAGEAVSDRLRGRLASVLAEPFKTLIALLKLVQRWLQPGTGTPGTAVLLKI